MDGAKVERQRLIIMHLNDDLLKKKYYIDLSAGSSAFSSGIESKILIDVMQDPNVQSMLDEEFQQLCRDREMLRRQIFSNTKDNDYPLPVNVYRVIQNAQTRFINERKSASDLHPIAIIQGVKALLERMIVVRGTDLLSVEAQRNATILFQILIRSTLATKRVLDEFKLDKVAFDWVLGEIERRFNQACVHPGEMVGTVAAQR